jgi:hypothetical protein
MGPPASLGALPESVAPPELLPLEDDEPPLLDPLLPVLDEPPLLDPPPLLLEVAPPPELPEAPTPELLVPPPPEVLSPPSSPLPWDSEPDPEPPEQAAMTPAATSPPANQRTRTAISSFTGSR